MSGRIFLVAAEPSGDALGADLIEALRRRDRDLTFAGIGGPAMARQGVASLFDIAPLSLLGFTEVLRAYPRVVALADEASAAIIAFKPDVVVLIDSWGFTMRVAQRISANLPTTPIVKYIGPQVWAYRAGRAKTLAALVDCLICIHDFEKAYYEPFALPVVVSGHPAFGRWKPGDGAAFRAHAGLAPDKEILLLLLGSRAGEIKRVAPTLEAAAAKLCQTRPNLLVVCVLSPAVAESVRDRARTWRFPFVLLEDEAQKDNAFAAGAAALAVSGTVATEVALQNTPVIVGYKLGWITWALLRAFLFKPRFITLFNIAAGREAAPEFVQTRLTADNVAHAAAPLLDDAAARARQVEAQNQALIAMGRDSGPAADIAADAVLSVLAKGPKAVRRVLTAASPQSITI